MLLIHILFLSQFIIESDPIFLAKGSITNKETEQGQLIPIRIKKNHS